MKRDFDPAFFFLEITMFFLDNSHLITFMLQFAIILGLSKGLGIIFQKFKQPTITADLIIGIILGPTILKKIFPSFSNLLFPADHTQTMMLETIAWTGIFFLLLETGLEVNFASIWKQKKQASIIAITGIIIPLFICFSSLLLFVPEKYLVAHTSKVMFSIFVAVTLTISAMPIAIRALYDLNILKSDMGFLVVSALTINDFIGWILFTIILGIYQHGEADFFYILKIFIITISFAGGSLIFLRKYIDKSIKYIKNNLDDGIGMTISLITFIGMVFGAITLSIGLHALLGFFLAGLIAGGSDFLTEKERNVINKMVYAIFVPFFFVNIGLKIDFLSGFNITLMFFITLLGVFSKFLGAWIGTILSRNSKKDRVAIAVAHTAGGEMQIVIAILALESGLISQSIFVAIVGGAILSTILLGPWLSWILKLRISYDFVSLFKKEHILDFIDLKNRDEVIHALSIKAAIYLKIDYHTIKDSIYVREDLISTAIGNNLAIPHARLSNIKKPLVLFLKTENDIEWNAPDGLPVHFIFLIITPEDQTTLQLKLLRDISIIFKNPIQLLHLRQANNKDDILNIFKEVKKPYNQVTLNIAAK